jgi:hypothetical protein
MNEKTSIIKKSTFTSEWMNGSGSLIYWYDLELENGETGSVGVAQKNSAKVEVGAEITYYKENAKKIKIVKHHVATTSVGTSTSTAKTYKKTSSQDAYLGYAWSYAKDLIIAGKTMEDVEELNAVARYIYDEIGKMLINEY